MDQQDEMVSPQNDLQAGTSHQKSVYEQLFNVRPGLDRAFKWFNWLVLALILYYFVYSVLGNRGNLLRVFNVTGPEFLFVLGLIAVSFLTTRIGRRLPTGHLLSAQSHGASEAAAYGGTIGVVGVVIFFLVIQGASHWSFYMRWGLAFLLFEVSQWVTIAIINRRRKTSAAPG